LLCLVSPLANHLFCLSETPLLIVSSYLDQ
jgi:hypothetical protein